LGALAFHLNVNMKSYYCPFFLNIFIAVEILTAILDSLALFTKNSRDLDDIFVVPVCVGYEKLPEKKDFLNSSSIWNRLTSFFSQRLGYSRVDFGSPFCLRVSHLVFVLLLFKHPLHSNREYIIHIPYFNFLFVQEFHMAMTKNAKLDSLVQNIGPFESYSQTVKSGELHFDEESCASIPSVCGDITFIRSESVFEDVFAETLAFHSIFGM